MAEVLAATDDTAEAPATPFRLAEWEAPGNGEARSGGPPAEPGRGRPPAAASARPAGHATPAPDHCPKCRAAVSREQKECPFCRTLLFFEAPGFDERMARIGAYNLGQMLFREREYLFEMLFKEKDLDRVTQYFAMWAYIFAAVYGAFLGTYGGWLQMPAVAGKVPLLLFGTLAICAPALFTFNVLLGSRLTFRQTLAILVVATYLTAAVLVSLGPIVLFFILSGSSRDFVTLLNVASCAIAGGFGVAVLWQGMRYMTVKSGREPDLAILKVWTLIYMFVGTQLAWTLRPFIGTPGHFALYRHLEGNFYTAMWQILHRVLGL